MTANGQQRSIIPALLALWLIVGLTMPVYAIGTRGESVLVDGDADAPTRLAIPSIALDVPVASAGWVEKSGRREWTVLDNAAGWHLGSARVGEVGNLVLFGHNNIGGSVFRHLAVLEVGDIVVVSSGADSKRFEVTKRLILREALQSEEQRLANARWIGDFGEERITLVTCYPAWANTHRLIVVAKPGGVQSMARAQMRGLREE